MFLSITEAVQINSFFQFGHLLNNMSSKSKKKLTFYSTEKERNKLKQRIISENQAYEKLKLCVCAV